MSGNKLDRRVRKSQQALGQALMLLLHRVTWDEITIQMVCDEADVARSSFYAHFQNKVDLLDHCIQAGLSEMLSNKAATARSDDSFESLSWLIDHVLSNRAFFVRMAQSSSGQIVFARFREAVHGMLAEELSDRSHAGHQDLAAYILGGSFALLQRWVLTKAESDDRQLKLSIQRNANALWLNP
jgi:AcrR family transcriptional regulator